MKIARIFSGFLLISCTFAITHDAGADIVLTVESVTVLAGSTGNGFDVLLTNAGTSGVSIDAFSFGLSIETDIAMTGATAMPVTAAYLFQGHSVFGPGLATSTGPTLFASDLHDEPGTGIILAPGATVGLGRVSFDVSPSASGLYLVSLLPFPSTGLSFAEQDVPIGRLQDGHITVSSAAVPEPSGLALGVIGGVIVAIGRLRRAPAPAYSRAIALAVRGSSR